MCALAHSFTVKESKLYTWNRSQINTVTSRSGSAQIECDAMCGGGCVYQLIKSYLSLWQTVPERPVLLTPKKTTMFPRMCVRVCVCAKHHRVLFFLTCPWLSFPSRTEVHLSFPFSRDLTFISVPFPISLAIPTPSVCVFVVTLRLCAFQDLLYNCCVRLKGGKFRVDRVIEWMEGEKKHVVNKVSN